VVVDDHVHANKNLVESLEIHDFQSAGGYPNRIRQGSRRGVLRLVRGAQLRHRRAPVDSLGRYRRSNQTVDMGATLRAHGASPAARATTR
jgi:hypothetical protein